MNIRKYQEKDFEATKYVCLNDMLGKDGYETIIEYVEIMFCRYYLEKEPENCFVAVDENDNVIGYTYGSSDYDKYQENFSEYINAVAEIEDRRFLAEALTEMYDHAIYKKDYPAHLHIDLLPQYQRMGWGGKLINTLFEHLRSKGIKGVMLTAGTGNTHGTCFCAGGVGGIGCGVHMAGGGDCFGVSVATDRAGEGLQAFFRTGGFGGNFFFVAVRAARAGINCLTGFGAGASLLTFLPQLPQKRSPSYNFFPQLVQNMSASSIYSLI